MQILHMTSVGQFWTTASNWRTLQDVFLERTQEQLVPLHISAGFSNKKAAEMDEKGQIKEFHKYLKSL